MNKLVIKDFQAIESAEIEFGGLTVIVGESRTGKSSVIRAISRLMSASPGTFDVSVGKTAYRVAIARNGHVIIRKKGPKTNEYHVDGQVFTKVGRLLPPGADTVLDLAQVEVGKRKTLLNIQDQFDGPFLVAESPSVVSEFLGSVIGVDELYALIGKIDGDRVQNDRKLDAITLRHDKLAMSEKNEATANLHLAEAAQLVKQVEGIRTHRAALNESIKKQLELGALRLQYAKLHAVETQLNTLMENVPDFSRLVKLKELLSLHDQTSRSVAEVVMLAKSITTAEKELSQETVVNNRCVHCGSVVTEEQVKVHVHG